MDGLIQPQQLDYAARPSLMHQVRNRLGWTILILLIGFIFLHVGPAAWRNVQLLYLQDACLRHELPDGQIALASYPWTSIVSKEWMAFYKRLSPSEPDRACLYLHERVSASGKRRLISVTGYVASPIGGKPGIIGLYPIVRLFRPGTATTPPKELPQDTIGLRVFCLAENLTVYGGQSDPQDASHFTLRTGDGQNETILDGWLRDDDTVLLEARPTQPLPSTAGASP